MARHSQINKTKAEEFTSRYLRPRDAVKAVMSKLGCSRSKAEKIQRGTYPSKLVPLETMALAKLWNCSKDEVYEGSGDALTSSESEIAS